jgi:hypothetical protein
LNVATVEPSSQPLNQHRGDDNNSEQEAHDNNGANNIQFSLVFVIAGRNSVQQMIEGTSFHMPSGHGNGRSAGIAPLERGTVLTKTR